MGSSPGIYIYISEVEEHEMIPTLSAYVNENLCRSLRTYLKRNTSRSQEKRIGIFHNYFLSFLLWCGSLTRVVWRIRSILKLISTQCTVSSPVVVAAVVYCAAAAPKDLQSPGQFLGFFKLKRTSPPPITTITTNHHHQTIKNPPLSRNKYVFHRAHNSN